MIWILYTRSVNQGKCVRSIYSLLGFGVTEELCACKMATMNYSNDTLIKWCVKNITHISSLDSAIVMGGQLTGSHERLNYFSTQFFLHSTQLLRMDALFWKLIGIILAYCGLLCVSVFFLSSSFSSSILPYVCKCMTMEISKTSNDLFQSFTLFSIFQWHYHMTTITPCVRLHLITVQFPAVEKRCQKH